MVKLIVFILIQLSLLVHVYLFPLSPLIAHPLITPSEEVKDRHGGLLQVTVRILNSCLRWEAYEGMKTFCQKFEHELY